MRRNLFPAAAISIFLFSLALAAPAQNTITTIAGGGPPNGVKATTVPIGLPWDMVQDAAGNTYISDNFSNRIFKVDTSGNFSVIAGTGLNNETGDGGPAIAATLSSPEGIALDTTSNVNTKGALYIADTGNNMIRVVNTNTSGNITLFNGTGAVLVVPAGQIAVVAGTGAFCTAPPCGDGSLAASAELTPGAVAVDSSGDIFIADTGDPSLKNGIGESVVREVAQASGKISTVAGSFAHGYSGDGGPATAAQLNFPQGLYLDSSGDIYIADTNNAAVRVVNRSGATKSFFGAANVQNGNIATVAGTPPTACAVPGNCGDGVTGGATSAQLNGPIGLFLDGAGNLWIGDTGNAAVRRVDSGATIHLAAGSYTPCGAAPCGDGGPATGSTAQPTAELTNPSGVLVDGSGNLLIADRQDDAIRKVTTPTTSGNISTLAGVIFNVSYYGNPAPGTSAELNTPEGVATDSAGNVYIADTGNGVTRKWDAQSGNVSTVAGNGAGCTKRPCGDLGPATSAQFVSPEGVFTDHNGNIYVADANLNVIRVVNTQAAAITFNTATNPAIKINPGDVAAIVASYSGSCKPKGTAPECGDGGLATLAQLGQPADVFLDNSGNIYIADTGNNVIRFVNTQTSPITPVAGGPTVAPGDIATVAGDAETYKPCTPTLPATSTTCGDGSSATTAQLSSPEAVFVDGSGNIFISDNGDFVVRKVDAKTGTITTVAGSYTACSTSGCGDGGPATLTATFRSPWGLWLDYAGNIFIADAGLSSIRAVNMQSTAIEVSGVAIGPGDITTVVGNGVPGFAGDGGPATSAELDHPHGIAGDAAGDLFITDFGSGRVRKVAKLLGTAPTASPSTSTLTFPDQQVGTSSSLQSVTITNNGNVTSLTVTGVAISGTNAADFSQSNTCTSVAAGSTCTIHVTFKPSASGTRTATLKVTDNAANSPQTISLTGTAVTPAASLSPSKLTFSSQAVGTTSASQSVTITNNQNSTILSVSDVTISGTNAADFTQLSNCKLLAANSSCVIGVVFKPSASGTRTATLTVTDDAANSPQTVTLSGTAVATFTLNAGTLSQTSVSPGGSATSTITMAPGPGFTGTVALVCSITTTSTPAPTCLLKPTSLTAASPTSTLTINTTANTSAMLSPATSGPSNSFYAVWLLLPAMLLSTVGLAVPSRRKLLSWLLIGLAIGGCLFLVACGGGSSNSGGGTGTGGSGGTPSGTYTVTVTATASGIAGSVTTNVQLTVN